MIMTICIENSNIILSGYNQKQLFLSYLRTDLSFTADEYAVSIRSVIDLHGYSGHTIEGTIICSVVPPLDSVIIKALGKLSDGAVFVVGPGVKTGLNIRTDQPSQLGSDRVCTAVAALNRYHCPAMIFNMNTATTISILDANKNFTGGSIIAGINTEMKALSRSTAQLPEINLDKLPPSIIGTNTIDAMRSGALYGNACMIDGLIDRHREILGENLTVIATGQSARPLIKLCRHKLIYDKNLLMDGLKIIYDKNIKG